MKTARESQNMTLDPAIRARAIAFAEAAGMPLSRLADKALAAYMDKQEAGAAQTSPTLEALVRQIERQQDHIEFQRAQIERLEQEKRKAKTGVADRRKIAGA